MRDLMAELKELRLHGMATAWAELTAQGESNTASSKWLLEHLLEQEHRSRHALGEPPDEHGQAADAPRSGQLRFQRL